MDVAHMQIESAIGIPLVTLYEDSAVSLKVLEVRGSVCVVVVGGVSGCTHVCMWPSHV